MRLALQRLRYPTLIYALCLIILITRVVVRSFAEEDSFITFRVVDNFVNGFGLR